jgi:hypothetical protein
MYHRARAMIRLVTSFDRKLFQIFMNIDTMNIIGYQE